LLLGSGRFATGEPVGVVVSWLACGAAVARWWSVDGEVVARGFGGIAASDSTLSSKEPQMNRTTSPQMPVASSPLAALDAAFVALTRGIRPLTLPAALFTNAPASPVLPVDEVRTRLVHPSCRPQTRARIWSEAAFRSRRDGEPWTTVVAGFAVPGLCRVLGRLPRVPQVDPGEIEQEALAGLLGELAVADPGDPLLARGLFRAADRAAHQFLRAARRRLAAEDGREVLAGMPPVAPAEPVSDADEYTVLWQAVRAQVIAPEEADLIARTRLDQTSVDEVAAERGVSRRTVFRQRSRAEKNLVEALRQRAQVPPQG
jgi:DNA-directed RNA polymerase specialized sigma24 family protein